MLNDLASYSDLMEKCSHCAFCEATCPVYLADLLETQVARSRMLIVKETLLEKNLPFSKRAEEVINRCLLCSSCQQTCPVNVPVDEIVMAARYQVYKGKRLNLPKRMLLKQVMEKRGIKGLLKKADLLAKSVGISPKEIPPLPKKSFEDLYQGTYEPEGKARDHVGYFVGCATNTLYPDTGDAVMKVLQVNGIKVTIPDKIVCCGIPALAEGDIETARELMEKNVNMLAELDVNSIITDCTSCGLTLKKKLLQVIPEDDPLSEKARAVASKIVEVTDYLNQTGLTRTPNEVDQPYTYHVPCHGNWTETVNDAPRSLLSEIPGTTLKEMEEPEKCCGAGGIFFMDNKKLSQAIRAPKIKDIKETGTNMVITQCPSCRSYLNSGLDGEKQVMHPIALLARAYGFKSLNEESE